MRAKKYWLYGGSVGLVIYLTIVTIFAVSYIGGNKTIFYLSHWGVSTYRGIIQNMIKFVATGVILGWVYGKTKNSTE